MENESDGDSNCYWGFWYSQQRTDIGVGGNKTASGDHPKYRIIKIGPHTKKSPGDLRGLAVTQTPMENH